MIHKILAAIGLKSSAKPGDNARSPRWPAVRAEHLAKFPTCAACGTREHLEVHHKQPFHLHPDLELEPTNLITLCESPSHNCHEIFGHLLDWKSFNRMVEMDAAVYLRKVQNRPEAA